MCVDVRGPTEALRMNPSPRRSLRSGARVGEGPGLAAFRNAKGQTCLPKSMTRSSCCSAPPRGAMITACLCREVQSRSRVQRAVANLLEARLVKEMRAKAGAPIWRRDKETGQTYALKLTAAGAKVIAVDGTPPLQEEAERRVDQLVGMADPKSEPGSNPAATVSRPDGGAAPIPISPRIGTKVAEVIALLQRGDGANSR